MSSSPDFRIEPPRVAIADVNADGAPDIVAARRSQLVVFYAYP